MLFYLDVHVQTGCPDQVVSGDIYREGVIRIDSTADCKIVITGPSGSITYVEFLKMSLKPKTRR